MRPERTLIDVLRERAREAPAQPAFTFLADGEQETLAWSYAELERRSRAVALHLHARLEPGARVVLCYPPGLEFVAAFLGCLYAGMIAVGEEREGSLRGRFPCARTQHVDQRALRTHAARRASR